MLPRAQTAVVSTQQAAPCPSYPAFVVALPQADLLASTCPLTSPPYHSGKSSPEDALTPEGLSESRDVLGIKELASTHTGRAHSRAVTQQWLNILRPVAIAVLAVPPAQNSV